MKRLTQNQMKGKTGATTSLVLLTSLLLMTGMALASTTTFTADSTVNLDGVTVDFEDETDLEEAEINTGERNLESADGDIEFPSTGGLEADVDVSVFNPEGSETVYEIEINNLQDHDEEDDEVTFTFDSADDADYSLVVDDEVEDSETDPSDLSADIQEGVFEVKQAPTIEIEEGFNTFSIPSEAGTYALESDAFQASESIDDDDVDVWSYGSSGWETVELSDQVIQGGQGYIIDSDTDFDLTMDVLSEDPIEEEWNPSSVELSAINPAWNLVGPYDVETDQVKDMGVEDNGLSPGDTSVKSFVEFEDSGTGFNALSGTGDVETGDAYWVAMEENAERNYVGFENGG